MKRSGKLVEWGVAIALITVAVLILLGALLVLVTALLVQPYAPYVAVREATLQMLRYDQLAVKEIQVSLLVEAHNDNGDSSATFSRLQCRLRFAGSTLAVFRADGPFSVPARGTVPLPFLASAQDAPLGDAGSTTLQAALRDGVLPFRVEGEARTRWEFAGLVSITQWTRLACEIGFFVPNGTTVDFTCTSKKFKLF